MCENNLYATETPVRLATRTKHFADRAAAYDMPGLIADGNDVLDVYEKALGAVECARSGRGPTLLEAKTYRTCGHYAGHGETGYRPKDELDAWRERDPIRAFSQRLVEEGVLDRESVEHMEQEAQERVSGAVRFAVDSPLPEPNEAAQHVLV